MAYVYGHYKKDTGEIFYIGKGVGRRAWSKSGRNRHWKHIVSKYGYDVKILKDDLSEAEALKIEKEMIAEIGLDKLANLLEGGEGVTSEFTKSQFMNADFKKKHKMGLHLAKNKMSDIKKRQFKENPDYCKTAIKNLQNSAHFHKRYEKIKCNICGKNISKSVIKRHQAGNYCRLEFKGLTDNEIQTIRNREKYRKKVNLPREKYRKKS